MVGRQQNCVVGDRLAVPGGIVLVGGSQFASAMEMTLRETFATPDGYSTLTRRWFEEMFTTKLDGRRFGRALTGVDVMPGLAITHICAKLRALSEGATIADRILGMRGS